VESDYREVSANPRSLNRATRPNGLTPALSDLRAQQSVPILTNGVLRLRLDRISQATPTVLVPDAPLGCEAAVREDPVRVCFAFHPPVRYVYVEVTPSGVVNRHQVEATTAVEILGHGQGLCLVAVEMDQTSLSIGADGAQVHRIGPALHDAGQGLVVERRLHDPLYVRPAV
jgi:hypothetical protein